MKQPLPGSDHCESPSSIISFTEMIKAMWQSHHAGGHYIRVIAAAVRVFTNRFSNMVSRVIFNETAAAW